MRFLSFGYLGWGVVAPLTLGLAAGKAMGSLNWFAVHPTSMTSALDALGETDRTRKNVETVKKHRDEHGKGMAVGMRMYKISTSN